MTKRLSGRVVMQRIANPSTPVRFRPQPPKKIIFKKLMNQRQIIIKLKL